MNEEWRSINVYYYRENKDSLLLDAIGPLLAQVAEHTNRIYFVRHWRRGPHVRIPVLATPRAFETVVWPGAQEVLGSYLQAHPSDATLPEEAELVERHRRLALLEQERGPLLPLVADNTILLEEHDRRLAILGGEVGADLLADFFQSTNDITLRMLSAVAQGVSRDALGLSLMLAVAHRYGGNPPNLSAGFVSFRSHAEAFLWTTSLNQQRDRGTFEELFRRNEASLVRLVHRVLATLDGDAQPQLPFVREWVSLIESFWKRARVLFESGQLPPAPTWDPADVRKLGDISQSPFHRMMLESEKIRTQVFDDLQFHCYRLAINYTYLHLARLGLLGYARFRLCHLAANAVEAALGLNAFALARSFSDTRGATPSAS